MWFLNTLSAVWNWLRNSWNRVWAAISGQPGTAVVVASAAVVVLVFSYRYRPEIRDWLTRAEPGQIVVNSPTVYTRQRLVNDRLDQTSWLREQLRLADENKSAAPFRIIDQVQSRIERRETKLEAAVRPSDTPQTGTLLPAGSGGGAGASAPDKDTATAATDLFSVVPTTAALFRAKNSYREEVRAEMTQTQLDDRHDIRGNTIYRLAFDATVITGTRGDMAAGVKVTLGHNPYADTNQQTSSGVWRWFGPAVESTAANVKRDRQQTLRTLYQADYEELYVDWMRHAQTQVATSLKDITRSFLSGDPDPNFRVLLARFLLGRICELATGRTPSPEKINSACDDPEKVSVEWQEAARINRRKATELLDKFVTQRFSVLDDDSFQQLEETLESYKAQKLMDPNVNARYVSDAAKNYCRTNGGKEVGLLVLGFSPNAKAIIGCPFDRTADERFAAAFVLYFLMSDDTLPPRSVARHEDIDVARILETLEEKRVGLCDKFPVPTSRFEKKLCGIPDRELVTRCFAADFLKSKLNAFDRFDPPPWERFGYFFKIDIVGREASDCQILISGDPRKKQHAEAKAPPSEELKYYLNQSTEAFSYSVSPKNLSESISTAAQTRDVFEMLARYGFRAGGNDATAFAGRLNARSDRLQGILAHPIVVGFGSGRHPPEWLRDPNNNQRSTAVIRQTSFGWLIAPRSRVDRELQQIDGQYALTAVISVPSWWRSVELEVETCWISREDLHVLGRNDGDGINICNGRDKKTDSTVIRLPGAIPELSRKLGFEVIQQPYLSGDNRGQELEIGQPGSLLLRGGRLWRSTEVTLGAQRANSIRVLPNMEGIIAHFSCVLPQPGKNRRQEDDLERTEARRRITQAEVQVWTSEGATTRVPVDLVWPDPLPKWPADSATKASSGDATKQDNRKWCAGNPEVFTAQ